MRTRHGSGTLGTMNEMYSPLDRLEARVDRQAARIDTLYAILAARGLLARPLDRLNGDELGEIEDAPIAREVQAPPQRRRAHFRVGDATGV